MKKIYIILLFALALVVSSCFTSYVSNKQVMGVRQGMTQQDVENIFGKPDYRRFEGNVEEWEFRRDNGTPVLTSSPMTIIVQFVNAKVVSMDTFSGYGRHTPAPPVVVAPTVIANEPAPGRVPVEEIQVMSGSEFDDFIHKLKFTFMIDEQKKLVESMLQSHDVTSDQCVAIVKEVFHSSDQVDMMKKLYPYVRDKQNFNKVVDILFSSTYKDEIRKFIKEYHQTNK